MLPSSSKKRGPLGSITVKSAKVPICRSCSQDLRSAAAMRRAKPAKRARADLARATSAKRAAVPAACDAEVSRADVLTSFFLASLHWISSVGRTAAREGVGPRESPVSPRTYRCLTAVHGWCTGEVGQAVAHRQPESADCASVRCPSACPMRTSREDP